MLFENIPARVAGYATYELVEKLRKLSPQQRSAVDRIVQHCYVDNLPLADLLRGEGKICSDTIYYRAGIIDSETGGWKQRPGWYHDKEFKDALETAARLALTVRSHEELAALTTARRRARLAADSVITSLVGVATMGEDKLRAAAGKVVLDYAGIGAETEAAADAASSDEMDWWKAADNDEQS